MRDFDFDDFLIRMGGLLEIATGIISRSQRSIEVSSQNISNISTPGYKSRVSFASTLQINESEYLRSTSPEMTINFASGKLFTTGSDTDLALIGDGFFAVQKDEGAAYTRSGAFLRTADGRLTTTRGYALQAEGGGDVILKPGAFQVLDDGSITQEGEPIARLALFEAPDHKSIRCLDGGLFTIDGAVTKASGASIKQGSLEASNVSTGDEMISIMAAIRRAETGQRMVMIYDDLIGRGLNLFGQA